MKEIILICDRGEWGVADNVAKALRAEGFGVAPVGERAATKEGDAHDFAALKDAKCAIAFWSREAAGSSRIRAQAEIAHRRAVLLNAVIDSSALPRAFSSSERFDVSSVRQDHRWIAPLTTAVRACVQAYDLASGEACSSPGVFISYSRADQAYATDLARHLEQQGVPVWFDRKIELGVHWRRKLFAEVRGCLAMIVLMSPSSSESMWVQAEYREAEAKRKLVIPILIEGESFPELTHLQYINSHTLSIGELVEAIRRRIPQ
jgi:hypothetical protein